MARKDLDAARERRAKRAAMQRGYEARRLRTGKDAGLFQLIALTREDGWAPPKLTRTYSLDELEDLFDEAT
jgi:hypothetical protein